jgi:hypothetical protein
MRQKFKDCLNRGKIILFPQGKHLVDKELNSARIDLEDAEFGAESFHGSMRMRESADYRDNFSQEGALLVIDRAAQFLIKTGEILSLA